MARSGMEISQFNQFMKRCSKTPMIRYVTPTIHPGFRYVVAVTIHSTNESKEFTITNNPNENFNLGKEVNKYLDLITGRIMQ